MKKESHRRFCKLYRNTKPGRKYCAVSKTKVKGKGKKKTRKKTRKKVERKKGLIWISTLDHRTCKKCWGRHGKTYPLSRPPDLAHENCRCQLFQL